MNIAHNDRLTPKYVGNLIFGSKTGLATFYGSYETPGGPTRKWSFLQKKNDHFLKITQNEFQIHG